MLSKSDLRINTAKTMKEIVIFNTFKQEKRWYPPQCHSDEGLMCTFVNLTNLSIISIWIQEYSSLKGQLNLLNKMAHLFVFHFNFFKSKKELFWQKIFTAFVKHKWHCEENKCFFFWGGGIKMGWKLINPIILSHALGFSYFSD